MIIDPLPHLLEKIDIILVSSITMMGFMIASLSILKMVIPKDVQETKTLKADILKIFKSAIVWLLISSAFSLIAFFFFNVPWMEYIALVGLLSFIISAYYIYRSVDIIFTLEDD